MSLVKLLAATDKGAASAETRATDLDGTNDYLSRASDFTGNTDGKTFTFSCWVYYDGTEGLLYGDTGAAQVIIRAQFGSYLVSMRNTSNVVILKAESFKGSLSS